MVTGNSQKALQEGLAAASKKNIVLSVSHRMGLLLDGLLRIWPVVMS